MARLVPHLWDFEALAFEQLEPFDLARVPYVGELLELPGLANVEVMAVRHTPGAASDAVVYVVARSVESVERALSDRLGAGQ